LQAALAGHGIELPDEQAARLAEYCRVAWEWNEKLNLTRHTDFEKFVSRDLVDSRMIAEQLANRERVLDVGTGGGVPGVVLAIIRPDLRVTLSESIGKKARAVADIVQRLGLDLHVPVHQGRAEELLGPKRFDSLVVRAVAPLPKLLTWFAPHWSRFGRLLVIKGPAWVEERHAAREKNLLKLLQLRKLATWPLPGTHSESVLLEIKPRPAD
jgi:16S rRNA (guanine527-N7)-methyltransferase